MTADDLAANLDRAREIRDRGIPVWVMAPNPKYDPQAPTVLPDGSENPAAKEYRYPTGHDTWTAETVPAGHTLEDHRPGWAVCMSTGHGLDGVDVDRKHGQDPAEHRDRLDTLGVPVLGVVVTPSGGAHFHHPSAGVCSTSSSTRGVDYRGRGLDGSGSGFLYLPGTERPKYPGKAYAWAVPIDPADLDDLGSEPDPEVTDAVVAYLTGLGYTPRTRAEETTLTGAEPVEESAVPPWLRELLEDLGPEWETGPKDARRKSRDRSERFHHLVAACRRARLTQGQAVTLLDPWCHSVGKFAGRVSGEVARSWGKVEPATEAYLQGLDGALRESPSEALDRLEREGAGTVVAEPGSTRERGEGYGANPQPVLCSLCSTEIPPGQAWARWGPQYAGHEGGEVLLCGTCRATERAQEAPGDDGSAGVDSETDEAPEVSSWAPVDLGPYLDGTYTPEVPSLLPRADGACLLYAGRLHSFHGESESGKSLVAQAEAARILSGGGRVLVVDFESDAASVVARLLALGASREDLGPARFAYIRPDSGLGDPTSQAALEAVLRRRYDLAIVDGVTEALSLLASSEGKPEEQVVKYMRLLPRRIARRTGAAVVQVDHVTKNADTRGRFALGSQHKLNALDGAAYVVEVVAPLGIGLRGVVVLRVAKDRPGQVRPVSGPFRKSDRTQEAARVVLDATEPGRTVVTVEAPAHKVGDEDAGDSVAFRPTGLMERVSSWLEGQPEPVSGAVVRRSVQGKDEAVLLALDTLVLEGFVARTTGARGAQLHASTRPYRQVLDPRSDRYSGGEQVEPDGVVPEPSTRPVPVPRSIAGEQGNRSDRGVDLFPGTGGEQVGNRSGETVEVDLWDTSRDPWKEPAAPLHACGGPSCSVPGCPEGASA